MIPKVIHYCWFGGKPLSKLAQKCINSWRKYCPDYEIIEWNEKNYDVNVIRYTTQAYGAGKFAFASDYARFDIVYRQGGIYLDVDVELLKSLDQFLQHKAYMGLEKPGLVNSGLGFGSESGHPLLLEICENYRAREFSKPDGSQDLTTVVQIVSTILRDRGLNQENAVQSVCDCTIYPTEFFQPMDYYNKKVSITQNTHSIHHYAASWYSPTRRLLKGMSLLAGPNVSNFIRSFWNAR